jgi:ubiquinone/menaquinone biosynthesis C-methylase UbiE
MPVTVEQLYGELWADEDPAFAAELDRSLNPRDPDVLYELFARFQPGPDQLVLDVGARDATFAVELVRRFGCRAVAVDPIPRHAALARATIAEAGLSDRIAVEQAGIEALPLADAAVDHVWCRDMLNHVDLPRGLAECRRVLRPDGGMLVYQTFATELLEPREAERLFRAMAIVPANMDDAFFEATARAAGLSIELKDAIDSEWRERWVEEGSRKELDALLKLARMRRNRDALVARFGEARYEAAFGGALWGIYQLLGKLRPTVYLLRRPS